MIAFEEFYLDNGLRVIVHEDHTVPVAVLNLLYDVGSKDENPFKTGFAHLFEHLMFGGSVNIPNYDEPLQKVGGENNAFTSPDITNYYLTVPADNIETGFWLESDRMLGLSFDPKVLEVQRKVVVEEFKQRYLNQPYGDVWLKLRPLAYEKHPYRWPTIGMKVEHINEATMEDVKAFFYKHYRPNRAVLVVGGNVTAEQVRQLSEKWFGPIPAGEHYERELPKENYRRGKRVLTITEDVPSNALYMSFPMCGRFENEYFAADLLSDILGSGKSSRLYRALVKEQQMFSSLGSFVTGSIDPGLLVISGKLHEGYTSEEGEEAVWKVINRLLEDGLDFEEVEKVKNQAESGILLGEIELLNRAMSLAFYSLSDNINLVNEQAQRVRAVHPEEIEKSAKNILREDQSSVLYYKKKA